MRRYYPPIVLLSLWINVPVAAQLTGFLAPDTLHRPCAWDSSTTIFTYQGWEAYQTLDNLWNGPKDSTICIDLAHQAGAAIAARIDLDDIDVARPVFVRALLDSANVFPLDSNTLYQVTTWWDPSDYTTIDTTGPCPDGLCSGMMLALRIPDSTGLGSALRWYHGEWDPWAGFFGNVSVCVPTEKFSMNDVRELILKITPQGSTAGEHVRFYNVDALDAEDFAGLTRLTEATMSSYQGWPGYYDLPWGDNLVMYEDSTYPSPPHISYLDVTPLPNVATPTTVTIAIQPYSSLYFQPYAELRGGFTQGSDSIRHDLQLLNFGADLCLSGIVEVIWQGGSRYVHHGGHVDFNGPRACMLFGKGGTLEVAEGSAMYYGHDGMGMMALKTGGHIQIDRNAKLVMQGTIVMYEYAGETTPADIYMTLPEGAKLTFAPGSHVRNQWSIGQDMKLYVYLDGGEVDKSGLPAEEQDRVVVIPLPSTALSAMSVTGDAGTGSVELHISGRAEGAATLTMVDAVGRLVVRSTIALAKGPNAIPLNTSSLGQGSYFISVDQGDSRSSGRFVIL